SCAEPGTYRLRVRGVGTTSESPPFAVGRDLLLHETASSAVDFFYVQRCGCEVPGWHKACHLDDAKLPDGSHLDLTGGWDSAGDYNKLMYEHGDGGVVFALATFYELAADYLDHFDRNGNGVPDALEEARWGADFVAKMQLFETGGLRNHIHQGPSNRWKKWSAPEEHTDNKIGTDDDPIVLPGEGRSPLVIGGWAKLSAMLGGRGIKTDYLRRAEQLWDHETKRKASISDAYMLLSALELYRTTGKKAYLDYSRQSVQTILANQVHAGRMNGAFGNFGQAQAAALAQFALAQPKDSL